MILCMLLNILCLFLFKQKTAYEMRISDWSSDVCSSDLNNGAVDFLGIRHGFGRGGSALGLLALRSARILHARYYRQRGDRDLYFRDGRRAERAIAEDRKSVA